MIPFSPYPVEYIYADYWIPESVTNNFLEILLSRLEAYYKLPGFAADFTASFEAFLQTVDIDEETPGLQSYTDPLGNSILTLADTQWFGLLETWPKQLENYPYIEFWHQLDLALMAENISGMGVELLGDQAWTTLFNMGPLDENGDIVMSIYSSTIEYTANPVDQVGTKRPTNMLADIGAVEK